MLNACNLISKKIDDTPKDDTPIAKVGNATLYAYDLQTAIPNGSTPQDSINVVRSFIDDWLRQQVILQEAEKIVPSSNQDFDDDIEKYRQSLLIHALEETIVSSNVDSAVTEAEIQKFFDANRTQYELQSPIVKGKTVKIEKNTENQDILTQNIAATDDKNLAILEDYCVQNAIAYNFNTDYWLSIDELLTHLPVQLQAQVPQNRTNTVLSDSLFNYYVLITDFKPAGSAAPLEFERQNIKDIIFLQRKQIFLSRYYQELHQKAVDNKTFQIFK
jgi:hypothetical protein